MALINLRKKDLYVFEKTNSVYLDNKLINKETFTIVTINGHKNNKTSVYPTFVYQLLHETSQNKLME